MDIENRILFEDNHLVVVNKKSGELSQGDKTNDITLPDLIKSYLKKKYKKPGNVYLGIIHRLDRPTSGIMVFAKTSKALSRLNHQFKLRNTKKLYWAIVEKLFPEKEGTLIHWMTRNSKKNKSKAHNKEVQNSKKAILHFKCIQYFDKYTLLEISLETGRHHQIRSQLSSCGYPIQGDLKYGAARSNKNGSISLISKMIEINHPIKNNRLQFTVNPEKVGIWRSVLYD